MEVFEHAATQMVVLFLLLFGGVIGRRAGLVDDRFDKTFSRLLMNIALPCLIVGSALSNEDLPDAPTIGMLLGASALAYVLICAVALVIPRLYPSSQASSRGAHSFIIAFGNVGFIGFPVLNAIFGPQAVLYGAIYNIPYNIAIFTVGVSMIKRTVPQADGAGHGGDVSWKDHARELGRSLTSPVMIASYASIALALLHVTDAGGIVGTAFSYMGQLTVPGSMLIVGSSLAKMSPKSTLGHLMPYVSAVGRLLVVPIVVWAVFRLVVSDPLVLGVLTVSSGMPAATMGTMLCLVHGGDVETMMRGTFITTVLSILTIPLLALLVV